jgi:hypothetical protein
MDTPDESPNAKKSSGKLKVPDALTVACPTCDAPEREACREMPTGRSHSERFAAAAKKALTVDR